MEMKLILSTLLMLSCVSNVWASMFRPDQAGPMAPAAQEQKLASLEKNILNMAKSTAEKNTGERHGDEHQDEMSSPSQIMPFLDEMETQVNGSHTAAQHQIDTLIGSFTGCTTVRGTADGEADTAKVARDAKSTAHKTCRRDESVAFNNFSTCNASYHTALLAKDAACDRLAEVVKVPSINLVPNIATEWVPWLTSIRDWANARLNETKEWQGKCQQATQDVDAKKLECEGSDGSGGRQQAYSDKKAACDIAQTQLEGAACSYADKFDAACQNHQTCHNTTKATYDAELVNIRQMESGRKREWWMIKRIKCYLMVMSAKGGQSDLDGCKTQDHTSDHLDLTYPALPSVPAACIPAERPCDAAYVAAEYSGFAVPTLPCSACGAGGPAPPVPVETLTPRAGCPGGAFTCCAGGRVLRGSTLNMMSWAYDCGGWFSHGVDQFFPERVTRNDICSSTTPSGQCKMGKNNGAFRMGTDETRGQYCDPEPLKPLSPDYPSQHETCTNNVQYECESSPPYTCHNTWMVVGFDARTEVKMIKFMNNVDTSGASKVEVSVGDGLKGPYTNAKAFEMPYKLTNNGNWGGAEAFTKKGNTGKSYWGESPAGGWKAIELPLEEWTFDPPLVGQFIKFTILQGSGTPWSGFSRVSFS